MSVKRRCSSLQVKPTWQPLHDIWRFSVTTRPLLLQGPAVPIAINEPTSVTLSPTITALLSRAEPPLDFLAKVVPFSLERSCGPWCVVYPLSVLRLVLLASQPPTFMNRLNPLLCHERFRHLNFSQLGQTLPPGF